MSPRNRRADGGDNEDDMRASWSLEDTEAVLRGHTPSSADAARLGSAIAALRSRAHGTANAVAVAAMAARLAEASRESLPAGIPSEVGPSRPSIRRPVPAWRRRVSLAGAMTLLSSAGLAGTAAAADGAAPGDALYGVDRALRVPWDRRRGKS